jgi:hypothetical protein
VSPPPGVDGGQALLTAVADVSSSQRPALIRLEPGVYTLAESLNLPLGVGLEGSGREQTRVVLQPDGSGGTGSINLTGGSDVRQLSVVVRTDGPGISASGVGNEISSVRIEGDAPGAVGITATAGDRNDPFRLQDVEIRLAAAGAGSSTGLRLSGYADLRDVHVEVWNVGGTATALVADTLRLWMRHTSLTAYATHALGLRGANPFGWIWMTQGEIVSATDDPSGTERGLVYDGRRLRIMQSTVMLDNGRGVAIDTSAELLLDHSDVHGGPAATIVGDGPVTARNTTLFGGQTIGNPHRCAAVLDENGKTFGGGSGYDGCP